MGRRELCLRRRRTRAMPKEKKEETTKKVVFKTLKQVRDAAELYKQLTEAKKAVEKDLKECVTDPMKAYLLEKGLTELPLPDLGLRPEIRTRITEKIDPQLLLEHRVSAAVIAACTVRNESAPYCQFQKIGGGGGKDGEE